ncbi:MAG: DUF86 domain-containing protein [Flavisolibacter sp.]|nr:DUF86 domain-containing protein [Flavisolibacter sp.]
MPGYTNALTLEEYPTANKTRAAVERNFQITGEAAARIPAECKETNPHIEWRMIKGFRNIIIHEYSGNNNRIVLEHYRKKTTGTAAISELINSEEADKG